jgi:hypothetical protein
MSYTAVGGGGERDTSCTSKLKEVESVHRRLVVVVLSLLYDVEKPCTANAGIPECWR